MISGKDRRVGVGLTGLLLLVLGPFNAWANDDAVETARLLAVLLDSGRVTVGMNQELINDPSKGYKGFTPEVFENQVIAVFKQRTGVDLATIDRATVPDVAKLLLSRLLEESKKTIASYQTVINLAGLKYKGLIPATFGTETAHRFENWSGVYLKQTAPERLLRNPKNKPDAYEAVVLQRFAASGYASENNSVFSEIVEEGRTVRLMLPLYYGKACLSCHGEPKGERYITGYPREGGKEGELGGAISVKLPIRQ